MMLYCHPVYMYALYGCICLYGWIDNVCQLELAGNLMLENVNKRQHFEACLIFLASKCLITGIDSQDDNGIPRQVTSVEFVYKLGQSKP